MKKRAEPTIKQRKAIDILKRGIVDNGSKVVSYAQVMREAGYSENTIVAPQKLTNSVAYKREILPLIKRLEDERDRAIDLMSKKIGKATYRDMSDAIDKLTKNIQLLSGGATDTHLVINISKEIAQKNSIQEQAQDTPIIEQQEKDPIK